MLVIGAVAVFLAVGLAVYATGELAIERRRVYRGLRSVRDIQTPGPLDQSAAAGSFTVRVAFPAMERLGRFGIKFTPAGLMARLTKELTYAGQPEGWDAERLVAVKILAGGGLALFGLFLAVLGGAGLIRSVLLMALLAALGFIVPDFILTARFKERQDEIGRALADALDVLSITVEAGLGFDAALARVSREVGGPLGQEFQRVLQEMQLGKARADAFRDLSERSTIPELKSFVLAMIQADIFGISVAKVLQVQSKEMRTKRRQRAEERAQKLPVKILFPLLLCIFPALFVVLLGPAAINVSRSLFHNLGGG